ncbi:MAG: hypothetical protein PHP45_00300 [Elusimicrobiales bacterium]|nr:hypothetical protein [Elusimicrobiales bacterium]
MKETLAFAEFGFLLSRWAPLTPYGRAEKNALHFFPDAKSLEAEYDLTEAFLKFISENGARADRLEFYLRRIPFIDPAVKPADCADIFAFKKFLSNVQSVFAMASAVKTSGVKWKSAGLLRTLSKGGEGETFYLSSAYSLALVRAREKILELNSALDKIRAAKQKEFLSRHSLDFSAREFLVVDETRAGKLYGNPDFFIEPYDSSHVMVRPVYGRAYLALRARRDEFLRAEKTEEAKILKGLSSAIAAEAAHIREYCRQIARIDILLSKARLAKALKLSRPQIAKRGAPIKIKKGRLPALERRLEAEKLRYTPLSCALDARVGVITGSNMGGKTVALKTVAGLQLCVQYGLFVPAESYAAPLFDAVHYVGAGCSENVEGLSSFGLELYSFMRAWKDAGKNCLLLLDEFARATNSTEAAALLGAVIESFCARGGIYACISTHFAGLKMPKSAALYRMKGFDLAAFGKSGIGAEDLRGRLKLINRFMRYELVRDGGGAGIYDALKVARLLGFDEKITAKAQSALENK